MNERLIELAAEAERRTGGATKVAATGAAMGAAGAAGYGLKRGRDKVIARHGVMQGIGKKPRKGMYAAAAKDAAGGVRSGLKAVAKGIRANIGFSSLPRLMDLAAAAEEQLHDFEAIDLRRDDSGCCFPSYANFPSLYLSGLQDKAIMKLPTEGQAIINYRVRSRDINENVDNPAKGPTYGATLDVQSIEDVPEMEDPQEDGGEGGGEDGAADLSSTLFLKAFGRGKGQGASVIGKKKKKSCFGIAGRLREFAGGDRSRDGEGRYANGDDPPGPKAFRLAMTPTKKKALLAAGGVGLVGAGLATTTKTGRRVATQIGEGVARTVLR